MRALFAVKRGEVTFLYTGLITFRLPINLEGAGGNDKLPKLVDFDDLIKSELPPRAKAADKAATAAMAEATAA